MEPRGIFWLLLFCFCLILLCWVTFYFTNLLLLSNGFRFCFYGFMYVCGGMSCHHLSLVFLLLLICPFSKERKKLGFKLEGWRGKESVKGDKGRDTDQNIL